MGADSGRTAKLAFITIASILVNPGGAREKIAVASLESTQRLGLEHPDDINDAWNAMRSIYEGSPMDNLLRYFSFVALRSGNRSGKEA